jgi:hypothetical protein
MLADGPVGATSLVAPAGSSTSNDDLGWIATGSPSEFVEIIRNQL